MPKDDTTPRCQEGIWPYSQCKNRGRFAALVQAKASYWSDPTGDPFHVHLCGTHNNRAKRGDILYVLMDGAKEGAKVAGVPAPEVVAARALQDAQVAVRIAERDLKAGIQAFGAAVINDDDLMGIILANCGEGVVTDYANVRNLIREVTAATVTLMAAERAVEDLQGGE
jgi:hypothetical protein